MATLPTDHNDEWIREDLERRQSQLEDYQRQRSEGDPSPAVDPLCNTFPGPQPEPLGALIFDTDISQRPGAALRPTDSQSMNGSPIRGRPVHRGRAQSRATEAGPAVTPSANHDPTARDSPDSGPPDSLLVVEDTTTTHWQDPCSLLTEVGAWLVGMCARRVKSVLRFLQGVYKAAFVSNRSEARLREDLEGLLLQPELNNQGASNDQDAQLDSEDWETVTTGPSANPSAASTLRKVQSGNKAMVRAQSSTSGT